MVRDGFVICVAAGNSGPAPRSIETPGDAENVITVGAINANGEIYNQSSRGPTASGDRKPDLVTIGVDVSSAMAQSKNGTSSMSGTSMAVAQVAGAAAILLQANSSLDPPDIKRILLKTADDLGEPGPDNIYGFGALNLTNATRSINAHEKPQVPRLKPVKLINGDSRCDGLSERCEGKVGDRVRIESEVSGDINDIKAVNSYIIGPDNSQEMLMDDLDANAIYSAYWETSFWTPGDYEVKVNLQGRFGEVASQTVPFHLSGRE
jgi:serine protease AprX